QVRRAIAMAIDPGGLVDKVLGGYGELPGGVVPPIYEDYHYVPDADVRYSFDPDAANGRLDEAGYRGGPGAGRGGPAGGRVGCRAGWCLRSMRTTTTCRTRTCGTRSIRTRRTRCWTRRGTGGARTGSGWTRKAGGWSSG